MKTKEEKESIEISFVASSLRPKRLATFFHSTKLTCLVT